MDPQDSTREQKSENITAPMNAPEQGTPTRVSGALVGVIVVVVLLLVGATYFLWFNPSFLDQSPTAAEIEQAPDPVAESLQTQSSADTVSAIEQDLSATDFSDLDADIQNINDELTP